MGRMTDDEIREAMDRAAPIASEIASQDNAATDQPYFVVYEGDPEKPRKWWNFVAPFLTRRQAEAFIEGERHNLRRPFIYVESAHNNYEIRAARQAFADVPALAAECIARGEEIASAERHAQRLAACLSNSDAAIKRMTQQLADATRRADEAEAEIKRARDLIDARGLARGLGGHYGLREVIAQQVERAESAEAEVARLRAEIDRLRATSEPPRGPSGQPPASAPATTETEPRHRGDGSQPLPPA